VRGVLLLPMALALSVVAAWFLWSTSVAYETLAGWPERNAERAAADLKKLKSESGRLKAALDKKVVTGNYIVVDVTNNRIQLRNGGEVVLSGLCSSGSGIRLKNSDMGKEWAFHTPQGRFKVISKMRNPIWKKPEWAYIEELEPVPTDPSKRLERGMLGEYGLYFGDGYLIHGTLYERLLGRSVSHGCIRVGRDDLRQIYETCGIETPIFIF
jgi:lipoprotein-anchoring transpeptidase ErfK/SrfK